MAIEGPIIQGSGQPLDSDLTSLAATGTAANKTVYTTSAHVWAETDITAAGRSMIGAANAGAQAALLTTLAPLASPTFTGTPAAPTAAGGTNTTQIATTAFVATNFQPLDADLTALAASAATAGLVERAGAATYTTRTIGVAGATDIPTRGDADTRYQAADATLTSIAALGTAADKIAYTTGIDTWAETAITAAGRAILDDANAGAQLTTLGVSAFAQTILDDTSAQAARTTLGNFYRYQLPEVFYKDNLAASTTNNDFQKRISTQGWVAPRTGILVAITVKLNDTITAGTVEFDVTVNGTESGSVLVTCTSLVNTTGGTATYVAGAGVTIAAGDVVGVSYTSDANLLPNGTIDAEAWVQIYEEAFVE